MTAKRTAIKVEITDSEKESMSTVLSGLLDLLEDMKNGDTMFFKERNGTYASICFEKDDIQTFTDFLTCCISYPAVLG